MVPSSMIIIPLPAIKAPLALAFEKNKLLGVSIMFPEYKLFQTFAVILLVIIVFPFVILVTFKLPASTLSLTTMPRIINPFATKLPAAVKSETRTFALTREAKTLALVK